MKSWGILIGGLILGIACAGFAQTDMNSLFSGENKNIIYSGEAKEYTGSPLVFIEGISDQPKPKNWRDELKIKLFGSMEIPQKEAQKPLPPLQRWSPSRQSRRGRRSLQTRPAWNRKIPE